MTGVSWHSSAQLGTAPSNKRRWNKTAVVAVLLLLDVVDMASVGDEMNQHLTALLRVISFAAAYRSKHIINRLLFQLIQEKKLMTWKCHLIPQRDFLSFTLNESWWLKTINSPSCDRLLAASRTASKVPRSSVFEFSTLPKFAERTETLNCPFIH